MIAGFAALSARVLVPVLEDLPVAADRVRVLGDPPSPGASANRSALAVVDASAPDLAALAPAILEHARTEGSPDGWLLVFCLGARRDAELARLRDALWPAWHVGALYTTSQNGVERRSLEGTRHLQRGIGKTGIVVAARTRAAVLAPDTTVAKFDKNAAGWNGEPGRPGYAHFRWMRRHVADFAGAHAAQRILDFGCGAGWVGIEAALASRARGGDPELALFDPSPEMVRIAEENAAAQGLKRCVGRTGFGEEPPFPAADEAPYDLVLSSGVVSFARDRTAWFDGLARAVAPGGTLVIGDIHPGSKGMRKRRAERPLLPVREMNALTREEARAELERRGFAFGAWSGYQRSDPLPQLLHLDATRLKGAIGPLLVAWNRRSAASSLRRGGAGQDCFDSWVMRVTRAG